MLDIYTLSQQLYLPTYLPTYVVVQDRIGTRDALEAVGAAAVAEGCSSYRHTYR